MGVWEEWSLSRGGFVMERAVTLNNLSKGHIPHLKGLQKRGIFNKTFVNKNLSGR